MMGIQNLWYELFGELLPMKLLVDSAAGKVLAGRRGTGRVRQLEVKHLVGHEGPW